MRQNQKQEQSRGLTKKENLKPEKLQGDCDELPNSREVEANIKARDYSQESTIQGDKEQVVTGEGPP